MGVAVTVQCNQMIRSDGVDFRVRIVRGFYADTLMPPSAAQTSKNAPDNASWRERAGRSDPGSSMFVHKFKMSQETCSFYIAVFESFHASAAVLALQRLPPWRLRILRC